MNALIAACGRSGRPDLSLTVLNEMDAIFGIRPDVVSYRRAVIACNQAEHEKRRKMRNRNARAFPPKVDNGNSMQW